MEHSCCINFSVYRINSTVTSFATSTACNSCSSHDFTNTTMVTVGDYSLTSKIMLGIVLESIVGMTIGGNLLVLLSVCINTKLRTPTNYLIVSLAVADLLLGTLVLPFSAILQLQRRWLFGSEFCDLWAAADVLCCTASILSLCAISIDRYIGVTKPLKHRSIMSTRRTALLIMMLWIISFIISLGPLIGWRDRQRDPSSCTVTTKPGYVVFSVTCSFYIPSLIIVAIYIRIYKEAKIQVEFLKTGFKKAGIKSSSCGGESDSMMLRAVSRRNLVSSSSKTSMFRDKSDSSLLENCSSSPPTSPSSTSLQPLYFRYHQLSPLGIEMQYQESMDPLNSLHARHKLPTNKLKDLGRQLVVGSKISKFNKECKAAKTLGVVVGVFLCCWLPFFFILPLDSLCTICSIPTVVFDVTFWLGYCNSLVNPVIYATWNKEFKKTFIMILKGQCRRRRRYRSQYSVAFLAQASACRISQTLIRSERIELRNSTVCRKNHLPSLDDALPIPSLEISDDESDGKFPQPAGGTIYLSQDHTDDVMLQTKNNNEPLHQRREESMSNSCC